MTCLPRDEAMQNQDFCHGKEVDYYAKAKATTDPKLKSAYEATAREFDYWRIIGSEKIK